MAIGDTVFGDGIIAAGMGLTFKIQPPVGQEWVIHNIYYGNAAALRINGPTTTVDFDTDTAAGARMGMTTHITNTYYLEVVNPSASVTVDVAFDGVQTK